MDIETRTLISREIIEWNNDVEIDILPGRIIIIDTEQNIDLINDSRNILETEIKTNPAVDANADTASEDQKTGQESETTAINTAVEDQPNQEQPTDAAA